MMFWKSFEHLPKHSPITYRTALICSAAFLTCLGLLSIYASSSVNAAQSVGNQFHYVQKQAVVALLGFIMIFASGHLSFRWVERITLPLLFLSLVLLCLVHLPSLGGKAKGATRWILLFGLTIQPGELAKLAVVLFLAKNLSRSKHDPNDFYWGILPNVMILAILSILLLAQPDFGSTVLLWIIFFAMMLTAGLSKKWILGALVVGFSFGAAALLSSPYRLARLTVFLDPWAEIRTGGFQIIQSFLGFQNGGFWGVGLGESRQKLFFLPEAHTDFILSVIGEELGLIGVILICILFAYIVFLGMRITSHQANMHRKFLAFGITILIGFQALINIGVTMGVLPTKGMTLPFVSHGANSLLVFLLAIAILARISQEVPKTKDALIRA